MKKSAIFTSMKFFPLNFTENPNKQDINRKLYIQAFRIFIQKFHWIGISKIASKTAESKMWCTGAPKPNFGKGLKLKQSKTFSPGRQKVGTAT